MAPKVSLDLTPLGEATAVEIGELWGRALQAEAPLHGVAYEMTRLLRSHLSWHENLSQQRDGERHFRERQQKRDEQRASADADYNRPQPEGTQSSREVLLPPLVQGPLTKALMTVAGQRRFKLRAHAQEPRVMLYFLDASGRDGELMLTIMDEAKGILRGQMAEAEKEAVYAARRKQPEITEAQQQAERLWDLWANSNDGGTNNE